MIKGGIVIVVLLLLAAELYAQKSNVGVKGGINLQEFNLNLSDISHNYHVGVFAKYDLTKKVSMQLEGLYALQAQTHLEEKCQLTEIQVPVLVKYYPLKPFYVQAGAQGNRMLSVMNSSKEKLPIDNPYTFAGLVGVGMCLPSGFDLSFRYLHPIDDAALHSSQFQLSIGFDIY
ncbi:PorT family protein [Reichenbachiella agarivorans]|uniref:PorT family protein n=1 Tax=Reichenbachiella agarivorans TaxID=2979464 RepID=A0ABY6CSB6_9BACT|nr:PorT family protein [Reichenbachiella agarivorans]UXP32333.1 PorT family protein [Reichenbachiella agarivorans]